MKVFSGIIVTILGLFFASLCAYILVGHFFYGNKFPIVGNSVYSDIALVLIFGFTTIVGIVMIVVGIYTLWESFRKLLKH